MNKTDPRIPQYLAAVRTLCHGERLREIPVAGDDDVGLLGRELQVLSSSLETRFEQLRRLSTVTAQINAGLLLDDVLEYVFEAFATLIPYDRIGCSLLERGDTIVRARWARSRVRAPVLKQGYAAPLHGSSLEAILETGQPRILNDLEAYLAAHPDSESTRLIVREGVRSSLTCPLVAMGHPIGFLFFSSETRDTYRDAHVDVYLQLAGQLSTIVEKGRLYQQLLELNDLKNRFLGVAAHDLRSPITVVKGYVGLLAGGLYGPIGDEQREVLARVEQTCAAMVELVDDLLDVSAIESGKLELRTSPTALAELLGQCHADHVLLARMKEIELALELDPDLPLVPLDARRVTQVLGNLIGNAIKFSDRRTAITLGARVVPGHVELRVVDQGPGIPESELSKLFSDFGRTSVKPTGGEKSTGLGLAIVKRIVEAHGGQTWAESGVGQGSTFRFTLPLEARPT
jgi:hypothetical protein